MERFRKGHQAAAVLAVLFCAMPAVASYVVEWSYSLSEASAVGFAADTSVRWDFDGDHIPDVFVTDGGVIRVLSGVSHSQMAVFVSGQTYAFIAGLTNTDGDANKELVVTAPTANGSEFLIYDCTTRNLEYTSPEKPGAGYSCSIADIDGDGKSEICFITGNSGSRILEVYGSTGAIDEGALATPVRAVARATPNPAQDAVRLSISPDAKGPVVITDVSGRIVRRLIVPKAVQAVEWNCCDDAGRHVPAGTYLYSCGNVPGKIEVGR